MGFLYVVCRIQLVLRFKTEHFSHTVAPHWLMWFYSFLVPLLSHLGGELTCESSDLLAMSIWAQDLLGAVPLFKVALDDLPYISTMLWQQLLIKYEHLTISTCFIQLTLCDPNFSNGPERVGKLSPNEPEISCKALPQTRLCCLINDWCWRLMGIHQTAHSGG